MDELNFKTKVFEGPLDLLLTLIAKHKLDIMDIEISVLLRQFLAYIEAMQDADIELAAEFMEMAARLIYIKTASLLPKHEVEEMKKELQGALIEYALCKQAAERLYLGYVGNDVFVRPPMEVELDMTYKQLHSSYELYDAIKAIFDKEKLIEERRTPPKPVAPKSYVSVFTKIVYVLRKIQYSGRISTSTLYKGQTRSDQVAIFLALLELSKYSRVAFSGDGAYLEFQGKNSERVT